MNYEKLISELNDHADWADANIYEAPITLPDDLRRAAQVIKRLDEARERANDKAHEWEGRCNMLEKQLEQVKCERDAAVSDIESLMRKCDDSEACAFCTGGEEHCHPDIPDIDEYECIPKWRGVKEAAE